MKVRAQGISKIRWLAIQLATRRDSLRFIYHPLDEPGGLRVIYLYDQEGYDVGQFVWRTCDICRRGTINKISLAVEWQRRGIGRRLIKRALRDGPDYTWVTTGQSPDAKKFFPAITAETGTTFTERGPGCPHMNAGRYHLPSVPRRRPPRPTVERGI